MQPHHILFALIRLRCVWVIAVAICFSVVRDDRLSLSPIHTPNTAAVLDQCNFIIYCSHSSRLPLNAHFIVSHRIIPPVAATPSAPGPAFSSSTATNRATSVPSRSEPARAPGHFPSPVSTSSLRTHRALFTPLPIFPVHVFCFFR